MMNPESEIMPCALPHVAAMQGYVPGLQPSEQGWVKLNTNENPFPPSPRVVEAIQAALGEDGASLRRYPNPTSAPLRKAIAAHHGLEAAQVLAGNGADDALNLLVRVFADASHPAGMTVPSYSLYQVLAKIQGAPMREVAFARDMALPVDAIANCGANLFFLTSPNAPTGVAFLRATIAEAAARFPGIFVVDETYAPFADGDCVDLLAEFPRLAIVRSFSKAYALAGMRVGYVLANPAVIDLLDRARDSYNLDALAQAAACAALGDQPYYQSTTKAVIDERVRMADDYVRRGWFAYPSAANFHFVEPCDAQGQVGLEVAMALYDFLRERKILVRAFPNHALTRSFLRISVGSSGEMNQLREALDAWQNR